MTAPSESLGAVAPAPTSLSWLQQRTLRDIRLVPAFSSDAFAFALNLEVTLELTGPLNEDALWAALAGVVRRHDVLRARIRDDAMDVADTVEVQPSCADVGEETDVEVAFETAARRFIGEPFDLKEGPLFRARLFRMGGCRHKLVWVAHHLVFDGWSAKVFLSELSALYNAALAGGRASLPDLDATYLEVVRRQAMLASEGRWDADIAFWRRQLDRPPPFRPRRACAEAFRPVGSRFELQEAEWLGLQASAQTLGLTPFEFLMAAFLSVLFGLSDNDDLIVGTAVAARPNLSAARLIGYFADSHLVRVRIGPREDKDAALPRVREAVRDMLRHQRAPYPHMMMRLQGVAEPTYASIDSGRLVVAELPRTWSFNGLESRVMNVMPVRGSTRPLSVYVSSTEGRRLVDVIADGGLFGEAVAAAAGDHVREALARMAEPAGRGAPFRPAL